MKRIHSSLVRFISCKVMQNSQNKRRNDSVESDSRHDTCTIDKSIAYHPCFTPIHFVFLSDFGLEKFIARKNVENDERLID